jgi:alkanesulfonate monooxygenase SsuD/methylene tetrahydromethanopterin reductase-like flavin-dependent oxidoreductase (luciferase family)
MKAIWTQTKAEYHGELVNFDPMMAWPKPVQKPHPPILVGGAFPYAARRAVRYGDGWIPTVGGPGQAGEVLDLLPKFHDMLKQAGRDPASCPLSLSSAPADLDLMKRARDLGVARVSVSLQAATEAEALPILDKWAALIAKV